MTEKVTCDICGTVFTNCFSAETNQAYNCASTLHVKDNETYIDAHYGSGFDTSRFVVKKDSLHNGKSGTVCDKCIEHLLEKNEIEEDTNFDYWKPLREMQELQREDLNLMSSVITDSIIPEHIGKTVGEIYGSSISEDK